MCSATLLARPFTTPGSAEIRGAGGVLKLSLETFSEAISFSELKPEKLRFYLKGQSQHINPLYQLLLNDCLAVVLSAGEGDTKIKKLNHNIIQAVGFSEEEGILPYPASSFKGYRLLTEYFIFPEKFMFLDFVDLAKHISDTESNKLDLYIYLRSSDVELEHNISEHTFALGCSPVVNLFQHRAEPIKLDHSQLEYQLVPDMRRPVGFEVYSTDSVSGSTSTGTEKDFHPFYGLKHEHQHDKSTAFWFASRRSAKLNRVERDEGTDVFLSLVDLDFNPNIPEDFTLTVETTCSNRDLPSKLPFNLDQPKLQCVDSAPPCSKIRCITQPSSTVRPPLRNHARWRLISHLNLNYLSLTGRDDPTEALQEILRLYDFKESSVTQGLIAAILKVNAKPISAPLNIDGHATICRGIEVEIELDDTQLTGSSSYLFASVLEQFFALYCSVNSFTRLLVKLKGKEGYLKKCPPRAGEKVLL